MYRFVNLMDHYSNLGNATYSGFFCYTESKLSFDNVFSVNAINRQFIGLKTVSPVSRQLSRVPSSGKRCHHIFLLAYSSSSFWCSVATGAFFVHNCGQIAIGCALFHILSRISTAIFRWVIFGCLKNNVFKNALPSF